MLHLVEIACRDLPPFPPFSPGTLPRPVIPPLPEFSVERLRPVLESVEPVSAPRLPAIPPLPTQEPVGGFRDAVTRALPLPFPDLSTAVTAVARAIVARTMNEALKHAAARRPEHLALPLRAGDDER